MEKLHRDPLNIKNWRPLTLMNVDYKLFSKIIANRIQEIINDIIHNDQTGFMKGSFIGENLLYLTSLIEYCEKNAISAIIISFDFEKAFGKVEWSVFDAILEFFNFGQQIRLLITSNRHGKCSIIEWIH